MKRVQNPPNPYESEHRDLLEPATEAQVEVFEDHSEGILSHNESPDLSFRWGINPYRGCFHSCIYCYARRTHEFLGFGAGTDFETKIVVKPRAPELLRAHFLKPSWKGELILFSGVTDCYQPLEAAYRLTRLCLEVCIEFQNPVGVITKSYLVVRDIDVLKELVRRAYTHVFLSIPFAEEEIARLIEPQAAHIERRFAAVEAMAKAGIPVGVSLAPIIPGLNDKDIPALLARAKEAGATSAFYSILRLPGSVKDVFLTRLQERLPLRYRRVVNRIKEARQGRLYNPEFFERRRGHGPYWKSVDDMFRTTQKRLGLDRFPNVPEPSPFRRPELQSEFVLS